MKKKLGIITIMLAVSLLASACDSATAVKENKIKISEEKEVVVEADIKGNPQPTKADEEVKIDKSTSKKQAKEKDDDIIFDLEKEIDNKAKENKEIKSVRKKDKEKTEVIEVQNLNEKKNLPKKDKNNKEDKIQTSENNNYIEDKEKDNKEKIKENNKNKESKKIKDSENVKDVSKDNISVTDKEPKKKDSQPVFESVYKNTDGMATDIINNLIINVGGFDKKLDSLTFFGKDSRLIQGKPQLDNYDQIKIRPYNFYDIVYVHNTSSVKYEEIKIKVVNATSEEANVYELPIVAITIEGLSSPDAKVEPFDHISFLDGLTIGKTLDKFESTIDKATQVTKSSDVFERHIWNLRAENYTYKLSVDFFRKDKIAKRLTIETIGDLPY